MKTESLIKSSGGKMVYNEQLKQEIPEGWEVKNLDFISTITGGSTPSKANEANFTKGGKGVSWITPKDHSDNKINKFISHGEFDVTDIGLKEASLKKMPQETVLMSSRAPIGYLAIASNEVTTNQGFKFFVPKAHYTSEFIFYKISNLLPSIINKSSGSTFKDVSTTTLKNIAIDVPSQSPCSYRRGNSTATRSPARACAPPATRAPSAPPERTMARRL